MRVWDLKARGPLGAPLVGHDDWVLAVAVGELGGRPIAVSGGIDGTVRVWDLEAGGPLGGPLVHDRFVNAVALGELHDRSPAASGDAGETMLPVVATAPPAPTGEPATTLGSGRVDQGGGAGSGGKSPRVRRRREGRAAAARGSGAATTKPRSLVVLASIATVVLGLVLVVAAGRDLTDILRPPSSTRRADGVVIDSESRRCGTSRKPSMCYRTVVRFVTARGQTIKYTSNANVGYSVGDSVKVRYDPDNPRHARLVSAWAGVDSGLRDIVILVLGLFVTLWGSQWFRGEVRRAWRPARPHGP